MYYAVFYDISHAKTRRLAVKLCKQAGLVRVQRSVFIGRAPASKIADMETELKPLLTGPSDSLSIQPLDRAAFHRLRFAGKKMAKPDILRKHLAVFV